MTETLFQPFLDALIIILALIAATRLNGLRSFSKLSAFDFAVTVAMGSVLAGAVLGADVGFVEAVAALAALFVVQAVVAAIRVRSKAVETAVDNVPLLLMEGETILDANLITARMTRADLIAKLREANVLDPAEVRAVVFETTGDVSVLHGPPGGTALADMLIDGVRRSYSRPS